MISQRSWHDDWAGLQVAVLGLGKSGFSVADTLIELGAQVTVFAANAPADLKDLLSVIGGELIESDSAEAIAPKLGTLDFAVVSPGFPPHHDSVRALRNAGIEILTDIDLAWRLRDKTKKVAKWITITGTNGKTTTTELVEHILKKAGHSAVACGNIGNPILDVIRDPKGFEYLVVELSSFQLHYLGEINAVASAFLNFAPDHVDWHGSLDSYFSDKAKIFNGTQEAIVYNESDSKTIEAAEAADVIEGCRAVSFTTKMPKVSSVGYVEEFLVDRAFIAERQSAAQEIATLDDIAQISVVSDHLKANVAAAVALTRAVGVSPAEIRQAITTFELSPHRIQVVAKSGGVSFVNDSKATNAHAAAASLSSFDSIIWIVGGLLKGVDPEPLLSEFGKNIKAAVLIGKDTSVLEELFSKNMPEVPIRVIKGDSVMEQAVSAAIEFAGDGDTVLLAPAAASMDQFKDYADRGDQFQAAVRKLLAP